MLCSEKAKLPKICLSFSGSMPEAQIKQCPLTLPNLLDVKKIFVFVCCFSI